jgi:hypothetical protein
LARREQVKWSFASRIFLTIATGGVVHFTRSRQIIAAVALVGLALGASACGSGASSGTAGAELAKQACTHVDRAVKLLAQDSGSSSAAAQLEEAEPFAARAASENGQWQTLSADLSELSEVDPSQLVGSLRDECKAVFGPAYDDVEGASS